jgi:hypothetical protein
MYTSDVISVWVLLEAECVGEFPHTPGGLGVDHAGEVNEVAAVLGLEGGDEGVAFGGGIVGVQIGVGAACELTARKVVEDVTAGGVVDIQGGAHVLYGPLGGAVAIEEQQGFEMRDAVEFALDELIDCGI